MGLFEGGIGAGIGNIAGIPGAIFGGATGSQSSGGIPGTLDEILYGGAGRRSAEAQQRIAEAQLAEQVRTRELATAAAEPSIAEMRQLERSIALNDKDIARKERLIASSDPALIEAGQQALALLRGQEAAILSPLKNQRAKERAKLDERLRAQLGTGYETSTAGLQALAAFDEASNNVYANAQQQSLAQLLGVAQNTSSQYGLQNNISNAANISNVYGNQSNRRVSAINQTPITAVGAQFAGDLANAQFQQATMNNLLNLGVQGASTYFGAQSGASKNPSAPVTRTSEVA